MTDREKTRAKKKAQLNRYLGKFNPETPEICQICKTDSEKIVKHIPTGSPWHEVNFFCQSCLQKILMNLTDDSGTPLIKEIPDPINVKELPTRPSDISMEAAKKRVHRWKKQNPQLFADQTCQICGDQNVITKIKNPDKPYEVNILCRSCNYKHSKSDLPPTINLLDLANPENIDPDQFETTYEAVEKLSKLYMSIFDIQPTPYCQVCESEIPEASFNLIFPHPKNPLQVYFLCPECYADLKSDTETLNYLLEDEQPFILPNLA